MCGCQNPTSPTTSAGNATDTAAIIKDGVVKTILERRSIRKYTNQPIENEKLAQIIECGLYAPNGMGRQSCKIYKGSCPLVHQEAENYIKIFL